MTSITSMSMTRARPVRAPDKMAGSDRALSISGGKISTFISSVFESPPRSFAMTRMVYSDRSVLVRFLANDRIPSLESENKWSKCSSSRSSKTEFSPLSASWMSNRWITWLAEESDAILAISGVLKNSGELSLTSSTLIFTTQTALRGGIPPSWAISETLI